MNAIPQEGRSAFTAMLSTVTAVGLAAYESLQHAPVRVQALRAGQGAAVFWHRSFGQNFAKLAVCV